jgi:mono/diheme cytochrome c family protein
MAQGRDGAAFYRKIGLAAGLGTMLLAAVWQGVRGTGGGESRVLAASAAAAPSPSEFGSAVSDGEAVYKQYCISCHAVDGHGAGKYPDLVSDNFRKRFGSNFDKTYAFVSANMPHDDPGSLSEDQYRTVVAYLQSLNGIATDFSDVDGYFAHDEIEWLWSRKYVDGYTEGSQLLFKPEQPITRAEFVRYLVKGKQLFLTDDPAAAGLTDIVKSKDAALIATAVQYGWIDGYDDHTFRPGKTITRAEIAAVLARSEGLASADAAAAPFSDVPASHWAAGAVSAAAKAGLFGGYDDGTFRPSGAITRGEAAAVLYRLLNPQQS